MAKNKRRHPAPWWHVTFAAVFDNDDGDFDTSWLLQGSLDNAIGAARQEAKRWLDHHGAAYAAYDIERQSAPQPHPSWEWTFGEVIFPAMPPAAA